MDLAAWLAPGIERATELLALLQRCSAARKRVRSDTYRDLGPAGESAGGVEVTVQCAGSQVATVAGRKQQGVRFVPYMAGQMPLDGLVNLFEVQWE